MLKSVLYFRELCHFLFINYSLTVHNHFTRMPACIHNTLKWHLMASWNQWMYLVIFNVFSMGFRSNSNFTLKSQNAVQKCNPKANSLRLRRQCKRLITSVVYQGAFIPTDGLCSFYDNRLCLSPCWCIIIVACEWRSWVAGFEALFYLCLFVISSIINPSQSVWHSLHTFEVRS